MQIRWSDLGAVYGPGEFYVVGVGIVEVLQNDIDEAQRLGDNPILTLWRFDSVDGSVFYRITTIGEAPSD